MNHRRTLTMMALFAFAVIMVIFFAGEHFLVGKFDRKIKEENVNQVVKLATQSQLWQPRMADEKIGQGELEINARAALALDFATGEVFYAKNPHQVLPFASLAKIMTAVGVLNHAQAEDELVVPLQADFHKLTPGSSYMGLTAGERYSVEDLLYGLLLSSGNDAALALALGVASDLDTFVYWMNRESKVWGLKQTQFGNPSGLDGPKSRSTAYDLAILTYSALTRYPLISQIVASSQHEIPYTPDHKYLFLTNFNDLMFIYPDVDGVKPGNTEEAGSCLITTSTREGKRVLTVVLGASARNPETIKLMDFAFEKLGVSPSPLK